MNDRLDADAAGADATGRQQALLDALSDQPAELEQETSNDRPSVAAGEPAGVDGYPSDPPPGRNAHRAAEPLPDWDAAIVAAFEQGVAQGRREATTRLRRTLIEIADYADRHLHVVEGRPELAPAALVAISNTARQAARRASGEPEVIVLVQGDPDRVARQIRASALREYADKHHPYAEGVELRVDYGTGVEYDAVCAGCRASWVEDEGGCTERAQLLAAAATLEGASTDG